MATRSQLSSWERALEKLCFDAYSSEFAHAIDDDSLYAVTSSIVERIPVFTSAPHVEIVTGFLAYCRQRRRLCHYTCVILDNHIRLIGGADVFRSVREGGSTIDQSVIFGVRADPVPHKPIRCFMCESAITGTNSNRPGVMKALES